MPYAESNMLKAVMKPSPSLVYNNLSLSFGNLVYAHTRQVCAVQPALILPNTLAPVRRVESPHTDVIHSVRACGVNDASYVVVTTEAGIQIWDKSATTLLHAYALPDPDAQVASRQASFARGVAVHVAADGITHICYGTSLGAVHVVEIGADGGFTQAGSFPHHKVPITALGSAYQSRRGKWQADLSNKLVSADEDGVIAVWDAASAKAYKMVHSISVSKSAVTSLAVRTDFVIAARLDGTVQIFGLGDGKLRSEFVAHSRWLSAMDIHPTKDVVATVSEDATVNVWALPIGGNKVTNLLSVCWLNAVLTGVSFCGPSFDDVAVIAYDTDEIRIYKH